MYKLNIIQHRKFWYTISLITTVAGLVSVLVFGFKYGLDFTGGSILEVNYSVARPENSKISESLAGESLSDIKIQPSGTNDVIIRIPEIPEEQHQKILLLLSEDALSINQENVISENRFESFGPTLGNELKRRSIYALLFVLAAIIVYLAYAFRKVSHPVSSWKFGAVAVIALVHDVLILLGFFAILGHFFGTEIDSLFITALLTLLGFSVHDTIITLDRVRENLFKHQDQTFADIVDLSINQTIVRSINTSATTLFAITAVYFFGGYSIKNFSLALIVGIFVGTYSSIFIAAPLMVSWYKFSRKNS